MPSPEAYFLTWTTYGTRIHGDERGSVDRKHIAYGSPFLPNDPEREEFERSLLKHEPLLLDDAARLVVDKTIRAHCDIRSWSLLALNVRTNHVHVIVRAPGSTPETAMGQMKAWSSRRLREAGLVGARMVWTPHGSTIYLWDDAAVLAKVDYVTRLQDSPVRFASERGEGQRAPG